MKRFLLIPLLSLSLGSGCASYQHNRVAQNGIKETTSFTTFLMMGKANKISSAVKDDNYTRKVSVGDISGNGDTEFLKALFEAGVAAGKAATVP